MRRTVVILSIVLPMISVLLLPGAAAEPATPERAAAAAAASKAAELHGPIDLAVDLREANGRSAGFAASALRPRALATADFDEDGVADVITGFAEGAHGWVALHRGDPDALFPFAPEAVLRRGQDARGQDRPDAGAVPPLRAAATLFELPGPADAIGSGDFDNDGHVDVLAASDGGRVVYLLRGDGRGGFAAPIERRLPGRVRGMTTGEMNRPDGLADFVLAVERRAGFEIEVFEGAEGAWKAEPETIALDVAVTSLALGDVNHDFLPDLVAGIRKGLVVVPGRDRKLSLGKVARESVEPARPERRGLDFTPLRVAVGRFGRSGSNAVALVGDDGALRLAETYDLAAPKIIGPARATDSLVRLPHAGDQRDDLLTLGDAGLTRRTLPDRTHPDTPGQQEAPPLALRGMAVAALPMRLGRDAAESLVVLQEGGESLLSMIQPMSPGIFTVTTFADAGPGSLRQAIQDANGTPGTDSIVFNIQLPPPYLIHLTLPLPDITDPVTIDGTTQPGYSGMPIVGLDGSALPPGSNGLVIRAGQSVVRGLAIHGCPGSGIVIDGAGNNFVEGNFLGTDESGTVAVANQDSGVLIRNSHLNTVGGTAAAARNVISGNMQRGVAILGPSSYEQEYVSTGGVAICDLCTVSLPITVGDERIIEDINVRVTLTHTFDADLVLTLIAPDGTRVALSRQHGGGGDNYSGTLFDDGGATPIAAGIPPFSGSFRPDEPLSILNGRSLLGTWRLEVIDTATGDVGFLSGWSLDTESGTIYGNVVEGNYIGTDVTGTRGIGNTKGVVIDQSPANTIGGTVAGARNVIAGGSEQASGHGVQINGFPALNAIGNLVQGNYIGTDATGLRSLPNLGSGVHLEYATDGFIGGTAAGAGNLISSNGQRGVELFALSDRNRIQGNSIGTDATGGAALLPQQGTGIYTQYVSNDVIGGDVAAARNVISGNGTGIFTDSFLPYCCITILGNYVGTDATGTQAVGNAYFGMRISSPTVQIGGPNPGEGNLISGNTGVGFPGLGIQPFASSCVVQGNIIGLDKTATARLGNDRGILINGGSNCRYGGTSPAEANVIAGNVTHGVWIYDGIGNTLGGSDLPSDTPKALPDLTTTTSSLFSVAAPDFLLAHMKVDVNLSHTFDSDLILTLIAPNGARVVLANRRGFGGDDYSNTAFDDASVTPIAAGVAPFSATYRPEEPLAALSGISIAGTWTLEIVDVAGGDTGILWSWALEYDFFEAGQSNYNSVLSGNYIGTNAAGKTGLGNGGDGIFGERSDVMQIGSVLPGGANVISGNAGNGITLVSPFGAANVVQSNLIGLAPNGLTPLPNGRDGIAASGPVGLIGGAGPAYGNHIAYNGGAGVSVAGSTNLRQTTIRGNSIHDNGGLGIDLAPLGVTLNDAGDNDSGANLLQNFPAVTSVVPQGGGVLISGTLASTAGSKFTVDVYGNPLADSSGYGEGRTWLGSQTLVTDSLGNAAWSIFTVTNPVGLVTATATDFAGNTSEFSDLAKTPQEASPAKNMMVATAPFSGVQMTYTPACGATDHVIYEGTVGPGSIPPPGPVWGNAVCGVGTSGTVTFFPGNPPVGKAFYFVIVGQNASVEGSYGQASSGGERLEATLPVSCDRPQLLGGGCF